MIRSNTTFGDATRGSVARRVVKINRDLLPETTPIFRDLQMGGEYPAVVAVRSTIQSLNVKADRGVVNWTITFGPEDLQIQGKLLKDEVVREQFRRVNERISSALPLRKDAFWEVWFGIPMLLPGNETEVPDLWGTTCVCPSITKEEHARQRAMRQQAVDDRWWYAWLLPEAWLSPLPKVDACTDLWEPTTAREAIKKLLRQYATPPMMALYEAWKGDPRIAKQLEDQGVPVHDKNRTRYQANRRIVDLIARFPPGEARTLCASAED
jgi:hypothetical protein